MHQGFDRQDSRLDAINDQVRALREELIAERASAQTMWAVHDQSHRHLSEARLEQRIQTLEEWRIEMVTIGRLVKLTLGTSIVGAAVSVLALFEMLNLH